MVITFDAMGDFAFFFFFLLLFIAVGLCVFFLSNNINKRFCFVSICLFGFFFYFFFFFFLSFFFFLNKEFMSLNILIYSFFKQCDHRFSKVCISLISYSFIFLSFYSIFNPTQIHMRMYLWMRLSHSCRRISWEILHVDLKWHFTKRCSFIFIWIFWEPATFRVWFHSSLPVH